MSPHLHLLSYNIRHVFIKGIIPHDFDIQCGNEDNENLSHFQVAFWKVVLLILRFHHHFPKILQQADTLPSVNGNAFNFRAYFLLSASSLNSFMEGNNAPAFIADPLVLPETALEDRPTFYIINSFNRHCTCRSTWNEKKNKTNVTKIVKEIFSSYLK